MLAKGYGPSNFNRRNHKLSLPILERKWFEKPHCERFEPNGLAGIGIFQHLRILDYGGAIDDHVEDTRRR